MNSCRSIPSLIHPGAALPESLKPSSEQSDRDQHFRIDHLNADLKKRSVRGGVVTLTAQACKFTLQMGSTAILARLLVPQDYGLIGMVAAVTGFVALFKDMGLSLATIQKAEINHRQTSTLFWVNVGVSSGIALLTAAIAPTVAWFFNEPRLTLITIVSAIGFIFGGLTVQHQALLNRQMRFTVLSAIDIVAMCFGVVCAIALAWYGAGYWALVVMQIAIAIAQMVGVWIACNWRPSLPQWKSGIRDLLTFGGNLTAFNIINYFSRNLDNILIGRYAGAQALGLYAKAYQLLLLPIQQINLPMTNVAIPALSRLQHEPEKYRAYYSKSIQVIVTVGMPIVAFLFVVADKLILLLLGSQWLDAVPIFQILSPAAFLDTFNVASGWVYISLGNTARLLRWSIFASTVNVIGFLIGIRWGAIGVATSFSITSILLRYPAYAYCFRSTPLQVKDLVQIVWKPAVAALTAGAISFAFNQFVSFDNLIVSLTISCCVYVLLYIGIWMVLPNGRQSLRDMLMVLKQLR